MRRYVAFLRGVSPRNAKMPELQRAFERAGFSDVKTVLSSGNVCFGASAASESGLERRAEEAMREHLGKAFLTIVRPVEALREILATNPFEPFRLKPGTKRVVTFLRQPPKRVDLPVELHGARILCAAGREVYTAYVPSARGPVFMTLIEKTLGKDVTTRTWETVAKLAR